MKKHLTLTLLIASIVVVSGACINLTQPRRDVQFFTLEYDPPPHPGTEPVPAVIRVERFNTAPVYNTSQIIYRDGSFKRDAYVYSKWRANPSDMVANFLNRDLTRSGLFKAVLPHGSSLTPTHAVEGTVEEFYESDVADRRNAVISLSIALTAAYEPDVSRRVLFQKTYHASIPCTGDTPHALAAAMSTAMGEISTSIVTDVYRALEERSRQPAG